MRNAMNMLSIILSSHSLSIKAKSASIEFAQHSKIFVLQNRKTPYVGVWFKSEQNSDMGCDVRQGEWP